MAFYLLQQSCRKWAAIVSLNSKTNPSNLDIAVDFVELGGLLIVRRALVTTRTSKILLRLLTDFRLIIDLKNEIRTVEISYLLEERGIWTCWEYGFSSTGITVTSSNSLGFEVEAPDCFVDAFEEL